MGKTNYPIYGRGAQDLGTPTVERQKIKQFWHAAQAVVAPRMRSPSLASPPAPAPTPAPGMQRRQLLEHR